mgnify:FL=1
MIFAKEEEMLQRFETEREYTEKLHAMRPRMIEEFKSFFAGKFIEETHSEEEIVRSFEAKIGSKSDGFAKIKSRSFHLCFTFIHV